MSNTQSTDDAKVIDPDGDVLLITRDECDETLDHYQSPTYTKILASSEHLSLASAFFKAQFSTNWRERLELAVNGSVKLHLSNTEHDSETMEILLNVFHGRQLQIPFQVSNERLWKVALATDYFLCHEALKTWGLWYCQQLVPVLPTEFTSWWWQLIFIAYFLGLKSLFQHLTQFAQQKTLASAYQGPSPILEWILEEIIAKRNAYLKGCFDLLNLRIAYLGSPPPPFPNPCSSHTPHISRCAHNGLLGDELSEHIAQMAEKLKDISDVPKWTSKPREVTIGKMW